MSDLSPALQVRGLGFSVPTLDRQVNAAHALTILDDVSFSVARSEVVSVSGPSGSGKTSLLMLLAGLERPTRGDVSIVGTSLGGMSENALAAFRRRNVGIVFQSFHLLPGLSALENVLVPLELAGTMNAGAMARDMLDAVGLGARIGHRPGELSGGEQQRVALARALVARPPLLLADEPTGNLDPATGETIIEMMFDLRRHAETTLMLITHDPMLAARCDRQLHLRAGRLLPEDAA